MVTKPQIKNSQKPEADYKKNFNNKFNNQNTVKNKCGEKSSTTIA